MAIIFNDNFNRADASVLGTASTGQTWSTDGTQGISGNKAFSVGGFGGAGVSLSLTASYVVRATFSHIDSTENPKIVFWRQDGFVFVGVEANTSGYKVVGFNFDDGSIVHASSTSVPADGDIITVTVNYATKVADVYLNGTGAGNKIITWTLNSKYDMSNLTGIGIGGTGTNSLLDDYYVSNSIADLPVIGAPSGTLGSATYATKQSFYSAGNSFHATRQRINLTSSIGYAASQKIYLTSSTSYATRQRISLIGSTAYATKQTLYSVGSVPLSTIQKIYVSGSLLYATLQAISSGGVMGSVGYKTQQILNSTSSFSYAVKQTIYQTSAVSHSTFQRIFNVGITELNTKQVITITNSSNFATKQILFTINAVQIPTKIAIYTSGSLRYLTKQVIYDSSAMYVQEIPFNVYICRSLSQPTKIIRSIPSVTKVTRRKDFDTRL